MKRLRILTGLHAGVQLTLQASAYRIGADEEADLQISDWATKPITLETKEDGVILALPIDRRDTEPAAEAAWSMADFEPRRWGDIVLCVGPDGAPWPADVELLERLMRPVRKSASRATRRWLGGGAFGVLSTLAVVSAGALSSTRFDDPPPPPPPLVVRVQRAIDALTERGVIVTEAGDKVVVQGLVVGADRLAALHRVLAAFPAERVERRYASTTDIAASIADALGSGLEAGYRGRGVFVVTGRAADVAKLADAATRLVADLAPLVRRIDVEVTELPPTERVSIGAALAAGSLQYVQTRDGAKHLSLSPEPKAGDPPARPRNP